MSKNSKWLFLFVILLTSQNVSFSQKLNINDQEYFETTV